MPAKYGEPVYTWSVSLKMPNVDGDKSGQWKDQSCAKIVYNYNSAGQSPARLAEREPKRIMQI